MTGKQNTYWTLLMLVVQFVNSLEIRRFLITI